MIEYLEVLAGLYLIGFAVYHIFTGIVSVFFPDLALKFYKYIYGFHAIEKRQLKLTLRPWGNLALTVGLIALITWTDVIKYINLLLVFAGLLIIRMGYRILLRREILNVLKVKSGENLRMIIVQAVGAWLFVFWWMILE